LVTREKNGRTSVNAHGRDDATEVGVSARDAAGAHEHVLNNDFFLLIYDRVAASGTDDEHDWMHAAEKIIGLKFQMEADAGIAIASACASFAPNAHIIIGAHLVINDCAREIVVGDHVGNGREPGGVSWR